MDTLQKFSNDFGFIKTLEEEDIVEGSDNEEDNEEEEVKFSTEFKFDDYDDEIENSNSWNDISKYVKHKASTLEERIAQIRKERQQFKPRKSKAAEITLNENKAAENKEAENEESENEEPVLKNTEDTNDETEDIAMPASEEEELSDVVRIKEKRGKKKKAKKILKIEGDAILDPELEYDPSKTFNEMALSRPLQKAITSMKFVHPTPIQAATIPVALMGRDIYGCAATGTGKTAAFMLPVLERLIFKPRGTAVTRVLVLLPTRELAVQVYQVSKQLAQYTKIDIGLSTGGLDIKAQEVALKHIPDIIIATPGRLIDHLVNTTGFSLHAIEILIIDEADRILDEYFEEQMKEIIKQCAYTRQTMLFSATLNDDVQDLAATTLKNPVKIFIDSNTQVASNLHQEFIRIRPHREAEREPILAALLSRTFTKRVMVFVQTKNQVHRLYIMLGLMGLKVAELNGNMNQPQRLESLRKFREEEVDILVATDVASRGLDIPGVKTIINFTMPNTMQHYIHRVGRTARAGKSGRSVSLAGDKERKILKDIVKSSIHPVKHRLVPKEVIVKYSEKLLSLQDDLRRVLTEQRENKAIDSMEKQVTKAEKVLSGKTENEPPKKWFQTPAERYKEKDKLRLGQDPKKRKKGGPIPTTEDRMSVELRKAAEYQARVAKRARRLKKINAIPDDEPPKKKPKKFKNNKNKKSFDTELTNTNSNTLKKMRYEATYHEKMQRLKKLKMVKGRKSFNSKARYKRKR